MVPVTWVAVIAILSSRAFGVAVGIWRCAHQEIEHGLPSRRLAESGPDEGQSEPSEMSSGKNGPATAGFLGTRGTFELSLRFAPDKGVRVVHAELRGKGL